MDHSTSATTMDVAFRIVRRRGSGDSVPAGPLRALVGRHERLSTREGLARQLEEAYPKTHSWARDEDAWSRWLNRFPQMQWVSLSRADEICCALGVHLSGIYPELYEPTGAEEESDLLAAIEDAAGLSPIGDTRESPLHERDEKLIDAWLRGQRRMAKEARRAAG